VSIYERSERRVRRTPRVRYPGHFEPERPASDKRTKWHDRKVLVSQILRFDRIGLEESAKAYGLHPTTGRPTVILRMRLMPLKGRRSQMTCPDHGHDDK
jgi:hypothetical protein